MTFIFKSLRLHEPNDTARLRAIKQEFNGVQVMKTKTVGTGRLAGFVVLALSGIAVGCDGSDQGLDPADPDTSDTSNDDPTNDVTNDDGEPVFGDCGPVLTPTYTFESQFEEGADSVSYGGQIARHVLVAQLAGFIGGLSASIDDGESYTRSGVMERLRLYVDNPENVLDGEPVNYTVSGNGQLAEEYLEDVSAEKNLFDKLAGNDSATDHVEWSSPGVFQGFGDMTLGNTDENAFTPATFLDAMFLELATNAAAHANGDFRTGPDGEQLPVHVTESGRDLQQLVQKFLLGAVAFSQGADDYLSDDVEGKGLLSSAERDGAEPFSALEHAWDEAYGYFGAARDYDAYTDEEIAASGGRDEYMYSAHDTNGDCSLSLTSEVNFGASQNAAKRDLGAAEETDFTADAFDAFVRGRQIITDAAGPLSDAQFDALVEERDRVVTAWEQAIAASVVHYINETIVDIDAALNGVEYSFTDQAKHWSEMKGFALSFQFNPSSPVTPSDFEELHDLLGDAPVIPNEVPATNEDELEEYKDALLDARALLRDAYDFAEANVEAW
jgi:hypothetical protein